MTDIRGEQQGRAFWCPRRILLWRGPEFGTNGKSAVRDNLVIKPSQEELYASDVNTDGINQYTSFDKDAQIRHTLKTIYSRYYIVL